MTETVTMALSELRSLITKAARGAGLSWGQAEEAGWAAEWLARRGMPAADWATVWLAARMKGAFSPVEVGVLLADDFAIASAMYDTGLPDGLVAPGYLLPFLHRLVEGGSSVAIVSLQGPVAHVLSTGEVAFGPFWQQQSSGWLLAKVDDAEQKTDIARRPTVSTSVLECLDGLALRTTVPRSESSRRDAGSIGGDND
jgi:hypothetical protein